MLLDVYYFNGHNFFKLFWAFLSLSVDRPALVLNIVHVNDKGFFYFK